MAFWVCYYHIIWATKDQKPPILPDVVRLIIDVTKLKSVELQCQIHAINTVEDHIHVAVSIPPKLAVAEWIRQIKGRTTREVNSLFPDQPDMFGWQGGYGVLTFGEKVLPQVCRYIEYQKEHHRNNALEPYLEQCNDDETY